MQHNTKIALDDNDLQAVTGGLNDGQTAGIAASAGLAGASAGALGMQLAMSKKINKVTSAFKAENKELRKSNRAQSKAIREVTHGISEMLRTT